MDRATLEALARETGGRFSLLEDFPELPGAIAGSAEEEILSVHPEELWDTPAWLLAVAFLLAAEWVLRKTWKLL